MFILWKVFGQGRKGVWRVVQNSNVKPVRNRKQAVVSPTMVIYGEEIDFLNFQTTFV